MSASEAAPCRHRGAPPDDIVDRVAAVVRALGEDEAFLNRNGLSSDDFRLALPTAIERVRGSQSASNSERREFLVSLFEFLVARGAISSFSRPMYGDDTVYRLCVDGAGDIAVVQKGCPDGRHSSVAWSVPDWASETYVWWLCSSLTKEPGWHVSAGVKRLRARFFNDQDETLDGVIFHNNVCGTDHRPCPKLSRAVDIGGMRVPPPCIWVTPDPGSGPDYNWAGTTQRRFPAILLSGFGILPEEAALYTGHVGFQRGTGADRTNITSRYGSGRVTNARS